MEAHDEVGASLDGRLNEAVFAVQDIAEPSGAVRMEKGAWWCAKNHRVCVVWGGWEGEGRERGEVRGPGWWGGRRGAGVGAVGSGGKK
jgi:hypothetical protein